MIVGRSHQGRIIRPDVGDGRQTGLLLVLPIHEEASSSNFFDDDNILK
jgi:hypothetical protein